MGEKSSGAAGDDESNAERTPRWLRFFDRMLWGVDAPVTDDDRSRRWDRASKDFSAILRAFR